MEPHPKSNADGGKKPRRKGHFLIGIGLVAWALAGLNFIPLYKQVRTERLLREHGITGTATVERKSVAPDGKTREIEYRVDAAGPGSPVRNVAVRPALWNLMSEGDQLPIRYVPAEPGISRLQLGETPDDNHFTGSATARAITCAGGVIVGGIFFVGGLIERRTVRRSGG